MAPKTIIFHQLSPSQKEMYYQALARSKYPFIKNEAAGTYTTILVLDKQEFMQKQLRRTSNPVYQNIQQKVTPNVQKDTTH